MCEFNDRTKEARPEDFVPDPDRFYHRRAIKRGKLLQSIVVMANKSSHVLILKNYLT